MQIKEPFKTDLRVGVRRLRAHIAEHDLDIEELAAGIYESPDDLRRFLAGENDEFGTGPLIVLLDDLGLNSEDVFRDPAHLDEEGARRYSEWIGAAVPLDVLDRRTGSRDRR